MTQVKLNKSALSLQQKNLKNYERYLPSLELKRKSYYQFGSSWMSR